ncbi:MAG: hypothetical protein ABW039_08760 [Sphingobium sp.]
MAEAAQGGDRHFSEGEHCCDDDDHGSTPARSTAISLLGLGGCTIFELGERLQEFVSPRHYWRHNIVCDMSAEIDVSSFALGHDAALRVLDKHGRKFHRRVIDAGQFDILLLECSSDFMFSYLKLGDAILPDIRNGLFQEGWQDISFDAVPALRDAQPLRPDQPQYWDLWKHGFARLYQESLARLLRDGKQVLFVKRLLCAHFIEEDGHHAFDTSKANDSNAILREIFDFVEGFPGITLIDAPEELHYSSPYAPWSGPWEAHPEMEFYDQVGESILRKCAGDHVAGEFRKRRHSARIHARVAMTASHGRLVQSHGVLVLQNQEQERQIAAQALQIDQRTAEVLATRKELGDCKDMLRSAMADREQLAARVALLQKRYAPVRAAYKLLTFSRLRRYLRRRREGISTAMLTAGVVTPIVQMTALVAGALSESLNISAATAL